MCGQHKTIRADFSSARKTPRASEMSAWRLAGCESES